MIPVLGVSGSGGPRSDARDAFALADKRRLGGLDNRLFEGRAHRMVVSSSLRIDQRWRGQLPANGRTLVSCGGRSVVSGVS